MVPEGWKATSLGGALDRVSKPVQVLPNQQYTQIGIRSHGRGLFIKEPVAGWELGDKRVFHIEANCLILNIVFAWEQAVGKTDDSHIGLIASHRFPMYRPRKGACDIEFLRYFFLTPHGKHLLGLASPGGAGRNKTLGQKEFERLAVTLPPLPEQKKIAEILFTWDKAIETTDKLLANAEAQKRALMQQLLTGKRRLKGFERGEWKSVTLGDVLVIEYGKSPKAIFSNEGRYPIIGTGGETGRTDEFLIDSPAIVIGRKGTIDKPTMIEEPFWPIDTTFSCIAKPGFDIGWIFRALQRVDLRRYNEASGVPSLSRETLRSIPLVAPQKEEQAAIRDVIDHADQECMTIRRDLGSLQAQKRSLMQQLLTGKRRVTV